MEDGQFDCFVAIYGFGKDGDARATERVSDRAPGDCIVIGDDRSQGDSLMILSVEVGLLDG
jgi:hypothetical protein